MTKSMGRVICGITISADGYSAGLNQTEERPFGDDFATEGIESALAHPPLKLEQVKSRAARLVTHVTYRVLP